MTTIKINNSLIYTQDIEGINEVSFNYLGQKVYSAQYVDRLYGIFLSNPIAANSNFLKWNKFSWSGSKPSGTEIYIYIKSAGSASSLDTAIWHGPYINQQGDISSISDGMWLQFLIVLRSYKDSTPTFDSFNISYLSSEGSIKFFTRAFELNFVPQHIFLTYNATASDDDIIRFAISGDDSADLSNYQYINPNKIEELSLLSFESKYIKVLVELISATNVPATVHEFAVMFSGENENILKINKIYMESSSSSTSSSSSSTSSSSSSSSSIDSSSTSSSESFDNVSSSSSSEDYSESSSTSSSSSAGYSSSSSFSSSSSIDSSSSSYIENWSTSSSSRSSKSSMSSSSSTSLTSQSTSSSTSSM